MGPDTTFNVPPSNSTRSRIDNRPRPYRSPLSASASSGSADVVVHGEAHVAGRISGDGDTRGVRVLDGSEDSERCDTARSRLMAAAIGRLEVRVDDEVRAAEMGAMLPAPVDPRSSSMAGRGCGERAAPG